MKIDSKTNLYCIFGNPVEHSLSPVMQNCAFLESKINAVYLAFQVKTAKEAINSMKFLNIKGASITIPFKIEALDYIDEIDPLAREIGSVNTLHNRDNRIFAYNTDGYGAMEALKKAEILINDSSFLIIGNGGSARAIAFTLISSGANIFITGRNDSKINSLRDDIKTKYSNVDSISFNNLSIDFMKNIDVIINTTPVGMHPKFDSIPINESYILKKHSVFDIVYSPDMTLLLQKATLKNCRIIKGIEMLIYQGAKQFEIWTGKNAPIEMMHKSIRKALSK